MLGTALVRSVLEAGMAIVVLAACSGRGGGVGEPAPVATVAGHSVSAALLSYYVKTSTGAIPGPVSTQLRKTRLDELIALEAAASAGERLADADVSSAVELARLGALAHAAAEAAGVYREPTEQELADAYQAYVKQAPAKEYHVAHILVGSQAQAIGIIGELSRGANFATVAALRSADDSKARGGDLGWIYAGHLPQTLLDAAAKLEPGAYGAQPIHTPYGWHVVRLIERRDAKPSAFDQVKAQIAVNIRQDRYREFLRAQVAKTEILTN